VPVKHRRSKSAWKQLAGAVVVLTALAASPSFGQSLSKEEIRALVERAIANQHRNDEALAEYERRERRLVYKKSTDSPPTEDKTFRVVPTGTGTLRLVVEESGQKVEAEFYRKQLRDLEQALVWALEPEEPKQKQRVEKWNKRVRERRETVDGIAQAFRFEFLGREISNGRRLVKLALEPEPGFKASTRTADMFRHVRATVWIDEAAEQLARVQAELFSDISFGGGVFGKVYRGGRFVLEQAEVARGVWLPVRIAYDFDGRKFLFGFELLEVTTVSGYGRIGPPREALAAVRHELSTSAVARPAQ
jgi:hypothetical protein